MPVTAAPPSNTKTKLLDSALTIIRTKGYSATTVDDICEAAGVTKGAFFHQFKSKKKIAIEGPRRWGAAPTSLFESAPYRALPDPLDRVLAYVDFRKAILQG